MFVQEVMCAKVELIWRWSKKSPHSGGGIWSNLSQFLKKCDFFHHLQITNFLEHGDPHVPIMATEEKLEKEYFTMPPEV